MKSCKIRLALRAQMLAAGAALSVSAVSVSAQQAAEPESTETRGTGLEEIVVTGQRAAERAALEAKKNADNTVEALYANDVGKLPDQNVAEAVSRLSGISTATDKGEGRYIVIRGLEPNLANVTINNQTSTAPEPESRQVKLDDIPSSLIGSVRVIKTLTADLDANAIAGQVDIDTLSAFDKDRPFATSRLVAGRYELGEGVPYEGDLTLGTVFGANDQFGIVVSGNYSMRPINSDNLLTGDQPWQRVGGREVPVQLDIRKYDPIERSRTGGVINFDWRPSDDTQLFLRAMYAQYQDEETRNRFRIAFPTSASAYANQTDTTGDILRTRAERYVRKRTETDSTWTYSAGGHTLVGTGTVSLEMTHARAKKHDPIRDEWRFRTGSSAVSATYDLSDELFTIDPSDSAFDPAQYRSGITYNDRSANALEVLDQVRVDYELPLSWGDRSALKFGAKYLDRDKSNNRDGISYEYAGSSFSLADATSSWRDSTYDGRYAFGPLVDFGRARGFFDSNRDDFEVDDEGSIAESLGQDYEANEKIAAGYVMLTFKRDNLTVIPGVRYEQTKGDYAAKTITSTSTVNDPFDSFGSREYSDVFPGLNVRYDFSANFLARAAVTTAIGRPDYVKLAPSVAVDVGANEVALGNPELKPLRSVNYDLSFEYYFGNQGIVGLGLFRKEISDPIYDAVGTRSGAFGGLELTDAVVTQPRNADEATVNGAELNAAMQLTFLPAPFDGFGVGGNVTYIDGKTKVPGRSDEMPMYLQSDLVASAQVYYEKHGFSGRVAYAYRSKYLDLVGESAALDAYTDAHGQVDARVGYDFSKQFSTFFEAQNLTNEHDRRFMGRRDRMVEDEMFGRLFRLGVQINL